ncbi:MAG: hypothetical protein JXA24_02525 [Proteobacteria bacterium]|nr:hypothetical protein [Pseudomonadota bacterium]
MIRFFFNRFSKAVMAAEAAGVALFAAGAVRLFMRGIGVAGAILPAICLFLYAFIRLCASIRWYRDAPRYSGIELQFKKAMVPTGYAMSILGLWLSTAPSVAPLVLLLIVLAVVAHVNVILIYFHFRDRDPTPVNYFSRSQEAKMLR